VFRRFQSSDKPGVGDVEGVNGGIDLGVDDVGAGGVGG